jgi:hypothetical protein
MGLVSSFYYRFLFNMLDIIQSFEENSSLEGILTDLVIPSVKRKEVVLREKGLVALGLCCLIAKVWMIIEPGAQHNY